MSSANKAKGTRFETAITDHLAERGVYARRLPRTGVKDVGDVELRLGDTIVVLEAKAVKKVDLAQFVGEAAVEAENYAAKYGQPDTFGAVVVKRRMKGTGEAYVVMELDEYLDLLLRVLNGG